MPTSNFCNKKHYSMITEDVVDEMGKAHIVACEIWSANLVR